MSPNLAAFFVDCAHTFGIFVRHVCWAPILYTQGVAGAKVHETKDISYKQDAAEVELDHYCITCSLE